MACHTPPLKKVKKQGEMPLPSLGIPSLNPFCFSEKIFCFLYGLAVVPNSACFSLEFVHTLYPTLEEEQGETGYASVPQ